MMPVGQLMMPVVVVMESLLKSYWHIIVSLAALIRLFSSYFSTLLSVFARLLPFPQF